MSVVREQRWDENGKLVRDFTMQECDPDYERILLSRKAFGDEG